MATQVLVRLKGASEEVLEELVKEGFFSTKSEALRAGVLELGKEYNILRNPLHYKQKLQKKLEQKKITLDEIEKALSELED